jgi:hypothetical protein
LAGVGEKSMKLVVMELRAIIGWEAWPETVYGGGRITGWMGTGYCNGTGVLEMGGTGLLDGWDGVLMGRGYWIWGWGYWR